MRLLARFLNSGLTVEDAEGASNLLMLLTVLTLSFTLPVMYGTDPDVLVAADERECRYREEQAAQGHDIKRCNGLRSFRWGHVNSHPVISYRLADASWMSVCFLNIALVLAASCLLCLYFNRARACPAFFQKWFRVFQFWVFAGYSMYWCGLQVFLFAMVDFTSVLYPNYSPKDYFNPDTGEMVVWDDGKPVLSAATRRYAVAIVTFTLICAVLSAVLSLVLARRAVAMREIREVVTKHKPVLELHGLDLDTLALVGDDGLLLDLLTEVGIESAADRLKVVAAVRAVCVIPRLRAVGRAKKLTSLVVPVSAVPTSVRTSSAS